MQAILARLIAQVEARQRTVGGGATIVGTVLQHLVGAKLDLALGREVEPPGAHKGASVNDAGGRGGDFDIGDTCVHVATAPGEALIAKCLANTPRGAARGPLGRASA